MNATLLVLFALLGVAAALVAVADASSGGRNRRLAARLAEVSQSHARARAPAEARGGRRRPLPPLPPGLRSGVAALFGPQAERRDQYPAAPGLIVALAAVPALLLGFYLGTLLGGWARLLALPLWVGGSRLVFARIHGRRAAALYLQLPDSLAMVVRTVRAGVPVVEALRTVGREVADPTGVEFRKLSDQVSIGIPLEAALRSLARRSGLREYGFFAVALTLQNSAGGNLTDTLDNLADVVRKRVAMRQRGIALASQANASAYILAAVPAVTVLALMVINPGYMLVLFDDPRGKVIFALAVASLLGGLGVMRGIIAKSLS